MLSAVQKRFCIDVVPMLLETREAGVGKDPTGDRHLAEHLARSGGKQTYGPKPPHPFRAACHLTNLVWLIWTLCSVGTESQNLLI